jgi:hypothetical protein
VSGLYIPAGCPPILRNIPKPRYLLSGAAAQGQKDIMPRGPAIMLNFSPCLNIVYIHLRILSGCEQNVAKYDIMV